MKIISVIFFALVTCSCSESFKLGDQENSVNLTIESLETIEEFKVANIYFPQLYIFKKGEFRLHVPGYLKGIEEKIVDFVEAGIELEEPQIEPILLQDYLSNQNINFDSDYTIVYFQSSTCKWCREFEKQQASLIENELGTVNWIIINSEG